MGWHIGQVKIDWERSINFIGLTFQNYENHACTLGSSSQVKITEITQVSSKNTYYSTYGLLLFKEILKLVVIPFGYLGEGYSKY